MIDDYLNQFLGGDKNIIEDEKDLPVWVSDANSSKKAYDAINMLEKAKNRYIKGHDLKSDYRKKSLYQISKTEVADKIGKTPQAIFSASGYSESLSDYFNSINNKLNESVESRISKKSKGLQNRSKAELKKSSKDLSHELNELKQKNCEDLYETLLSNMALDVKTKLGVK